jgi:pimeloyl-ACP methyl ester carboxylesterase
MPPLRFLNTAAGPVRYCQSGQGADVVLLHGAMTSIEDMLLGPFDALAAKFRVTAFDRPGHGATPRRRLQGSPSAQAGQMAAAMAGLGLERPVVIGQSFGAALAMTLALAAPQQVRAVVAISPIVFPEWRLEHVLYGPRSVIGVGDLIGYGPGRILDALLLPPMWQAIFAPQLMPARYAESYPFMLASGPSQMVALGEEAVLSVPDLALTALRLPSCEVAVTVMTGTADWLSPPWTHAAALAAMVPKARLCLLPGLGHMLHHFAQSEIVAAVEELVS